MLEFIFDSTSVISESENWGVSFEDAAVFPSRPAFPWTFFPLFARGGIVSLPLVNKPGATGPRLGNRLMNSDYKGMKSQWSEFNKIIASTIESDRISANENKSLQQQFNIAIVGRTEIL